MSFRVPPVQRAVPHLCHFPPVRLVMLNKNILFSAGCVMGVFQASKWFHRSIAQPRKDVLHVCSVAKSCLCYPMDCSPPASSVHGVFQARILEWVAISSCRGSS